MVFLVDTADIDAIHDLLKDKFSLTIRLINSCGWNVPHDPPKNIIVVTKKTPA